MVLLLLILLLVVFLVCYSFYWFLSQPLHRQLGIVFTQVEVVERLLSKEGRDDVHECDQGEALLLLYGHLAELAEYLENLEG